MAGPINLINGMFISQCQDCHMVQVIGVNGHPMETAVSAVPALDEHVLTLCEFYLYDPTVVIQDVDIAMIHPEICQCQFILQQE